MLDNVVFGKYCNINSDIHNLNPLAKIINLLILSICLIIINDINILLIIFTFELILYLVSNISFKVLLKNFYSIKWLIVFIVLINLFSKTSIIQLLGILIKVFGITLYANIFVLTTTPKSILNGLNAFFKPLNLIGFKTETISFIISLALRFVPIMLVEANRILNSLKSRGLSEDSNISTKVLALKSLLIPIYLSSFRKSDNISDIMELRLYSINNKKNNIKIDWNYLDVFLVIIHVIILLISLKEVLL